MTQESDLVRNEKVGDLEAAISERIASEKARIAAARASSTAVDSAVYDYKTETEVFRLEQCYSEALDSVASNQDRKGLSAIEYCTMCIYYDS